VHVQSLSLVLTLSRIKHVAFGIANSLQGTGPGVKGMTLQTLIPVFGNQAGNDLAAEAVPRNFYLAMIATPILTYNLG